MGEKFKENMQNPINTDDGLFNRVVAILEEARSNVVRSVNTNMVVAYWLIGREIVEEIQSGEKRAEYGRQVLKKLSKQLNDYYGSGFSTTNLKYFRKFYNVYQNRLSTIGHPAGDICNNNEIGHLVGDLLGDSKKSIPSLPGKELEVTEKRYPSGSKLTSSFSPRLSWSHYRALMRVKDDKAREFYEQEAVECGWSKTQLERQIHTSYYQRIIANRGEQGLLPADRERLPGETIDPTHVLKSPTVLEFLGIPDSSQIHESRLEEAIINNLQKFLLELGKGFSFVSRQKHIRFDDDDFFVDLVFYNYILKCFLLIDLKMGKLTHADIGQMDGYVRLYEDQFKITGDNPTIGLVLCTEKNEAVAKYSVLNDRKQIFASKYLLYLPTEEELKLEIQRERRLIENNKEYLL